MTSEKTFDTIVIGLGGMGSATLYQLASRGKSVLGVEQFDIGHSLGSSHGLTRIIRLAYYEHPSYVPLLRRSYELWRELEQISQQQLLHVTGSIDAGPPGSFVFEGSRKSCEEHALPHDVLTSAELTKRFPGYRLPPETMAVFQPDGGFLTPEMCIASCVNAAQGIGAKVHQLEKVLDWHPTSSGVRVTTNLDTWEAESLVITAGAWASKLVPQLEKLAVPERQVVAWFQTGKPRNFTPGRFPVFNVMVDEGRFYGFPEHDVPGFKVGGYHHLRETIDPDTLTNHQPNANDEKFLRAFAARYFPDAAGKTLDMKVCMFTNTPDEHFILDLHPDYPQVSIAAGFSGHGFKFCSIVGEIMADLAATRDTRHDTSMFRLSRFDNLS
jgi:sarcosine oxidase